MIRRMILLTLILTFLIFNVSTASTIGSDNQPSSATLISPAANQPPVINCPNDTTIEWSSVYIHDVEASDPDTGQSITFSLGATSPSGAIINPTT